MITKARQIGFSTSITGWIYHKTIITSGVTSALIGYNNDLTAELLDKIKTFYRTTPDALKPTIHYNTKFEISFPKVDSKILLCLDVSLLGIDSSMANHNVFQILFCKTFLLADHPLNDQSP